MSESQTKRESRPDLDQILAKIDDNIQDWYDIKRVYDLDDDLIEQGKEILRAARLDSGR